jgi:hypothetical protein
VYKNAHRVSEYVTLCRIERCEQVSGEPFVSQSLQAKDRDHQGSCSPSQSLHPACEKRERGVQVLDPKGLVNRYLGTQNLDTT